MKTSISMCFEKVLRKEKKLISSLTTEGTMSSYKQHIGTTYTSQQLSSGIIKYYNLNILIHLKYGSTYKIIYLMKSGGR